MDFLIHHMLETTSRRLPAKAALLHGDVQLSYGQFAARCCSLAASLRALGVARGHRVGVYLDPSIPQALSIFAIAQAGGVCVPINTLLFPEQVVHIANDCAMTALIAGSQQVAALEPLLAKIPSLEFVVVVADESRPDLPVPCHTFDALSGPTNPGRPPDVAIGNDLVAILYTSGSTGKPKGVMLTHAQIMAGTSIVRTYLRISEADRILAVLPFSFDAGLNQLMTSVEQGATLVLMRFVFAREVVNLLVKERITGLAGVPTFWTLLAQPSSSLARHQLPDLRYITNTGGPMPQSVLGTLRQLLPTTQIYLMYGLTEAFRSTYLPPEELDRRPTSIGKAIPNTEILVISEAGRLCRPGEVGELVHRGPTVSLGYWGQPELTAKVLRPHPLLPSEIAGNEKVCYSGDLVTLDAEGFIYFVGRRDAMIKSSGFRISPSEVEEALFMSGRVREAAVIGVPDELLGQAIKAFIVPRDGAVPNLDELLAFCATQIPSYMVPKTVEVVATLPKTTSGKMDYLALRRREGIA